MHLPTTTVGIVLSTTRTTGPGMMAIRAIPEQTAATGGVRCASTVQPSVATRRQATVQRGLAVVVLAAGTAVRAMMMMLVMVMVAVDDRNPRRMMVALAATHRSREWRWWWGGQIAPSKTTTSGSAGIVVSVCPAKFVRIQPTDRRVATVSQWGRYDLWGHSACSIVW